MSIQNLTLTIVKNGYILPCDMENRGGVCDENTCFVQESFYDGDYWKIGGKYEFDKNSVRRQNKKVVFLGYFIRHWGHYLIDCLGRGWYVSEHGLRDYDVVFLPIQSAHIDGNYMRLLELLGVPKEKLLVPDQPMQFDEIIIPECATNNKHSYSDKWISMFEYIGLNADACETPSKVYLSRCLFDNAKNKEIGEDTIQKQFVLNGYKILYPEKMTVDEQISVFRNAKDIACLNGTIPLNILFKGNNKCNLIIINKTSHCHVNLEMTCKAVDIIPAYINGYWEPLKNIPRNIGEGPFWLGVTENMRLWFEKHNLHYDKGDVERKTITDRIKYIKLCVYITLNKTIRKFVRKTIFYRTWKTLKLLSQPEKSENLAPH